MHTGINTHHHASSNGARDCAAVTRPTLAHLHSSRTSGTSAHEALSKFSHCGLDPFHNHQFVQGMRMLASGTPQSGTGWSHSRFWPSS
mmetsp:Transcript_1339/g.2385  ORF Transcript_1339/g.2385 Transcript_1339/m.2385 type:complete len:88 (-) Transcript_1339:211-474(-)